MIKCSKCKFYNNYKDINCHSFFGNPNADILFVGECFHNDDKPFSTDIELIFIDLLNYANLKIEDVAITNAIHCYSDSTPTIKEIDACFINLYNDIKAINPKLIITMGDCAFSSVLGKPKKEYSNYIGKLEYSEKVKCNIYPVYQPSSAIYNRGRLQDLRSFFKKIPEILNNKPREIYHYPYTFIDNIKDIDFKIFDKSQYLFFDIETTGLNPFKDTIKILQISNGTNIFVLDSKLLNQFNLREFFNTKKLVGQDFNFDAKFLNNYHNLDLNTFNWYWDTCLAEYTISGMMDNDLTTLCWKYCPESGGYDDEIKAIGGAHLVKDPNKLHQYGANDIGILPKIMQKQYETLHQMGKLDLFRTIMMPTNRILTKASQKGVLYDVDYLNKLDKKYEKKSFLALEGIQGIHGVRETENKFQSKFNPGSDLHKKHLLFNIHKLPVLSRTDKGNPQCTKKEMAIYAEKFNNPYCLIMEKYGSIQTLRSNFLGGALQHLRNNIGHTRYSIHSTTTGRPNSREPNCFSSDTEVLTNIGWVYFKDLTKDLLVAEYDINTKEINFSKPLQYIKYKYTGDLINIKTDEQIDFLVTPDHRCLISNRKTNKNRFILAKDYINDQKHYHAGYFINGKINETNSKIILMCAFQADGHLKKQDGIVDFTLFKQRKIDRLIQALIDEKVPYRFIKARKKGVRILISRKDVPIWFTKNFDASYILSLNKDTLTFFSKECFFWDGYFKKENVYSSNNKNNCDIVQIAQILTGKRAKIRYVTTKCGSINWQIDKVNKDYSITTNHIKNYISYDDFVYCVSMPKSTVITRRNNKVSISGNCLNIPRAKDIKKCFISRPGHSFVYSDEGQLEVRVASVVYREPELIKICNDTTKDFHCNMTAKAFGRNYQEIYDGYKAGDEAITELRVAGKGVTFGILYGSGAEGIANQIGKSKDEAQKLIDEYFKNFPSLKRNIEKAKKLVIKQGFLDNYFGFRRSWINHTKEDHATLRESTNMLIQSLAWNFIELAMIQIDEAFIRNKMESQILLQIYDAVIVESPDDEIKDASRIVKSIMESVNQPYKGINEVKLISDIEVGKCLGEMEKIIIT